MSQEQDRQHAGEQRCDRHGRRYRLLWLFIAGWAVLVCAGGLIAWFWPPAQD